jgi:hypothetical protein
MKESKSNVTDHLIGTPLAFASESYAEKAWVKFDDIPACRAPNLHVIHGSVRQVDCETKIATVIRNSGDVSKLCYDYLVVASGLRRVWPVVPQSLRKKQYLFEAKDHIRSVTGSRYGVAIIGGGELPKIPRTGNHVF